IAIVPLFVQIGDVSLKDGQDIQADEVVTSFEEKGLLAKTAAVSIGEYIEFFKKYTDDGYHVIHVNIGGNFSTCYQNACLAGQEFDNVTVIDSQNLSTGQGHIVIRAAQLRDEGKDPQEIKSVLENLIPRIDASFLLDTLTYLHKGGRCSAIAALGGNLLKLKPCIEVKNGKMVVGKKYRGDLCKCYKQYVKDRLSNVESLEDDLIFVTHSPRKEDILEVVKNGVMEKNYFKNIEVTKAGCTITSHCGPKTLGILYIRK
ncbi:MAG: DegV family protein, partial [Bacillota bacterium]|nr:DegV family protein [Bacillota bacterium]